MKTWEQLIDRCLLFTEGHTGTLKSLLKEAEIEMVRNCDILEKTYSTTFKGNTAFVPLPSDYKKPIAIWVKGVKLKPISEADVFRNTNLSLNTGTPYGFYIKQNLLYFDKIPADLSPVRIDYYANLNSNTSLQKSFPILKFLRMEEEFHSGNKYTQDKTGNTNVNFLGGTDNYDYIYYSLLPHLAWNPKAIGNTSAAYNNDLTGGYFKVFPRYNLSWDTSTGGITGAAMTNSLQADMFIKNPSTLTYCSGENSYYYGKKLDYSQMHDSDFFITGPGTEAAITFTGVSNGNVMNPAWTMPNNATVLSSGKNYNKTRVALSSSAEGLTGLEVSFKRKYTEVDIYATDTGAIDPLLSPAPLYERMTAKLGAFEYDNENDAIIYDITTYVAKKDTDTIAQSHHTNSGSDALQDAKGSTFDISSNQVMKVDAFREYYPTIPSQYHLSLCDYAISIINAKSNPGLHSEHWQKWLVCLEQVLKEDVDRDLPHSIREEV
tara:strand:+ start:2680 stop:4152 length:1473 start_codon:yes stop_codon:yes gene_type:complete